MRPLAMLPRVWPTLPAVFLAGLAGLGAAGAAKGQPPAFAWARSIGGNGEVQSTEIAVDANGNISVSGYFRGTLELGTSNVVSRGPADIFLANYSRAGTLNWVRQLGGDSYETCLGLALGSSSDIYLCGTDSSQELSWISRLASNGNPIWTKPLPSAQTVATDRAGNVFVAGYFKGTLNFGGTSLTSVGPSDLFIARYAPNGDLAWARQAQASLGGAATHLSCDTTGNCYFTGYFAGTMAWGPSQLVANTPDPRDQNFFIAKCDQSGNPSWAVRIPEGFLGPQGIAVDTLGNAYIAGTYLVSSLPDPVSGVYLSKFNASGAYQWSRGVGSIQNNSGRGVAVDSEGSCYVAGFFSATNRFGWTNGISIGGLDAFVAKYTPEGAVEWLKTAGGLQTDEATGVALGSDGTCVIAGNFHDTARFGSTVLNSPAGYYTAFITSLDTHFDPVITTQPQGLNVLAGGSAKFNVTANSPSPLFYQWRHEGTNLPGQQSRLLDLTPAKLEDSGTYSVVVSNSHGSVTSSPATLTVGFSLTAETGGNGRVTVSPSMEVYTPGQVVSLLALPSPGFAFSGWSGDASGLQNPLSLKMDTNKTVRASFGLTAVRIAILGQGSVQKVPDKPFYALEEAVTLTATPGRWHAFSRWGDYSVANPRNVTAGVTNRYTAIFSPTTEVETLTFDNVSRLAPLGMPAVFVDGRFIVESSLTRTGAVTITLFSSFAGSSLVYTLDGSEPSLFSRIYSGPFLLSRSATIRSRAFDLFFIDSWEADPLNLTLIPTYALDVSTRGGGSVGASPASARHEKNALVNITATPAPGWTFLYWRGAASGTSPQTQITMTRDRCVEAVFGTPLGLVSAGPGRISTRPALEFHPYGSVVELTAVPQPDAAFALWGSTASGNSNPYNLELTNAGSIVSATFAPLPEGQATLNVLVAGAGRVSINRPSNRYTLGTIVQATALPDEGQQFLGWSNDAAGVSPQLIVTLNSSRNITANFTSRPQFSLLSCNGLPTAGERIFLLRGEPFRTFSIETSGDLNEWNPVRTVTNLFGEVQWTDAEVNVNRFYRARVVP